jgi:hypothetical protein
MEHGFEWCLGALMSALIMLAVAHILLIIIIKPYLIRHRFYRSDQVLHFAAPLCLKDFRELVRMRNGPVWPYYVTHFVYILYYLFLVLFVAGVIFFSLRTYHPGGRQGRVKEAPLRIY